MMTNDSLKTGFNCGLPYQVTDNVSRSLVRLLDLASELKDVEKGKHQSADYATAEAVQVALCFAFKNQRLTLKMEMKREA
jgi:uncharacterized protein YdeI (YjbR/CyaY-like superfamily)